MPGPEASLGEEWATEAGRWIRWARAPGHDSYWRFHRRQLLGLVPAPGRLTLDVGCGEGRVSRDLAAIGHRVLGFDVVEAVVGAAAEVDGAPPVAQADAAALPVADGTADLVVAFMSLHDVEDLEGAVAEAARVLEAGGRLHLAIVHPVNSCGTFDGPDRDAAFTLGRPYPVPGRTVEHAESDGLTMRFVSQHRPLVDYSRAIEAAGLVIETIREPTDPDESSRWFDVPLFLHVVAVKPPVAARADRRIFHITDPVAAQALLDGGRSRPPSLDAEGFVHCSTASQVVATTERWMAGVDDLVLVELDVERLEADLRWPEVYPGQRFPHLHGELRADAVVAVHPWRPADRQAWPG